MQIQQLSLENFRCFREQQFDFANRVNLLVGDNATGKSAIVDGARLALTGFMNEVFRRGRRRLKLLETDIRHELFMKGDTLTKELAEPCRIRTVAQVPRGTNLSFSWQIEHYTLGDPLIRDQELGDLGFEYREKLMDNSDFELPAFVAFGTERLWLQATDKDIETKGPESRLKGYDKCLDSASSRKSMLEWFKKFEFTALQKGKTIPTLEAVRHSITTCVPDATHVYFDVQFNQLVLTIKGESFPFNLLSDGYRNVLAMVADIAVRCATLNPHLEANAPLETEGVVLIDEIDLHLHPKWQRRVIGDLMRAFPKLQFIATTHSPFVIQSLPNNPGAKLINLDDPDNQRFADQSVEDIAEQIQGVELPQRSRRYVEMMNKAQQYFQMLERDEQVSDDERKAVRQELEKAVMPYNDSPAYQAFIRMQELAKQKNGGQSASGQEGDRP